MSSKKNDEILTRFLAVTQCSREQARGYLEAAKWDEQIAMDFFFDSGASQHPDTVPATRTRPTPSNPHHHVPGKNTASGTNDYDSDDDLLQSALEESLRFKPPEKPPTRLPKKPDEHKSIVSPKINTVDSFRHAERSSNDDKGQAYYAGGSERSGQQIIGPAKGKDNDKKVTNVCEAARRQGATEADDNAAAASASTHTKKEKPFTGAGHSLSDQNLPSRTQNPPVAAAAAAAAVSKVEDLPIRFYSNGFTVGDGELRKFEENKEFIECVKRGEVPPELKNMNTNGKKVNVRLEDHRSEEYKRVVPTFKPFAGAGHTVGLSGSGQVPLKPSTASPANMASVSVDTNRLEQLAEKRLRTSSSSTTIRLRLPDNSTPLCIKIDLNRTLADIRRFLIENVPSLQDNTFEFLEPPATKIKRNDERRKISDANLSNSTLAVRRIA